MRLVKIEGVWINPEAVAYIGSAPPRHELPSFVELIGAREEDGPLRFSAEPEEIVKVLLVPGSGPIFPHYSHEAGVE